jgi:hypothetical protein
MLQNGSFEKVCGWKLSTFVVEAAFDVGEMERKVKAKGDLENTAKWLHELRESLRGLAEAECRDLLEKSSGNMKAEG